MRQVIIIECDGFLPYLIEFYIITFCNTHHLLFPDITLRVLIIIITNY